MYNPNVPSSNMGIAPISGQPSQPMGPAPMVGPAPMGPPPPMAPPMMGGMPPPPMMAPPPMAPPIAPITEGLGGFGGSSAGRAGFSERMQKMTAPSKPMPQPQPQQMQQPVQGMQYGGMVRGMLPGIPSFGQLTGRMPYLPQRDVSNSALSKSGGGIDQYGEYLDSEYGDPQFDQKRDSFLQEVSQKEQQTFGGGGGMGGIGSFAPQVMNQPFMGGALQRGFPSYGIHRFNSSPFGGRFQLFEDGGEVPRDVSPVGMALGGFAGNPTTRDYSYTDPYEELDDLYDDIGGYDPTNPFGDGDPNYGGGGGDDDGDFNPPIPIPAPPVVVPDPKSDDDGDNDIKDRVVAEAAKQIAGARSDIQLSNGTVLSGSDLNAQLGNTGSVDAVGAAPVVGSGDAGPEIFTDVPNILGQNPISLLSPIAPSPISVSGRQTPGGGIVPDTPIPFGGSYVPPRVSRSTLSPDFAQPELLNENETEAFFNRDTRRPDMLNIALPGGSSKTRIEDDGLANAMAAAQGVDASEAAAINALGSDAYTGVFEPEFIEPTPAEVMASNRRAMAEARADDASGRRVDVDPDGQAFGTMGSYDGLTIPQSPRAAGSEFAASDAQSLQNTINRLSSGRENPDVLKAAEIENARLISQSQPVLAQPTGKLMFEGGPDFTARRAGEILDSLNMGGGKGAISPSPAPAVIRPQNTKYLSPFDISELENAARDYRETGAGSSDYDPMAAQATAEALKRAEGDVSALDRIAEARMPTDDMQIVPTAPDQTVPVPATATAGGTAPKANFDFKYPNTGKTDEVFIDPTDSKVYFDDRFDKTSPMSKAFSQLVSSLSYGLIDLDKISKKQRDKGEEAYKKTQTLAYDNKGRVIGVKDVDGSTIRLGSQPQDDDDTDREDGCPPGFRRVNGVCQPINGVSPNPADDIADDIERGTIPIIRPLDPPTGDVPTGPVTDDPSGIDFRRPNYFAGGGAVSEGMGSAIDNFISSMGGSVKKKSNVAPVGMANGGYVDVVSTYDGSTVKDGFGNPVRTRASRPSMSESEKDERNFSYDLFPDDVYGRGGRGVNLDPVAPAYNFYADAAAAPVSPDIMSSGFFDPAPAPVGLARSLRPQLRPASFLNESFGDRRQRLAGGPNVFDGAGPSYDVAAGGAAGYDPYVSNAISSVQDYYNDGSVGPTMQNANMLPAAPKNVNDITADYVKFIPLNMRNNLMMGKDFSRSLLHAGVDNIGGIVGLGLDDGVTSAGEKFFQTASENPLGTLYNIGLGAAQGVGSALYDPYKAVKALTDQFISSGKNLMQPVTPETNPDQLLGDISVVGAALSPFPKAAKVISSDVDAAQKSSAKKFNKSIEGTNFPSIGGFISPKNPKLNEKERNMINASLAEASAMDRRGLSPEEILSQTNVASLPIKDVAGNTVRNEMLYSFRPDEVNIDVSKLPTTGILGKAYSSITGKNIPTVSLSEITSKSPLKNIGSDLLDTTNVGMQTQLAMTPQEFILSKMIPSPVRKAVGLGLPAGRAVTDKTGTNITVTPQRSRTDYTPEDVVMHETMHANLRDPSLKQVQSNFDPANLASGPGYIRNRINELKKEISKGYSPTNLGAAKRKDNLEELSILKRTPAFKAYQNSLEEALARSNMSIPNLGVTELTRMQAMNPYINNKNLVSRLFSGLGTRDSRLKPVPMTYEMVEGSMPIRTRQDIARMLP